jgi:hypothetical protein
MARKVVAIHGIGDAQPGWSESLRFALDIPSEDWIEFYYDDLMDRSVLKQLIVKVIRIYLNYSYGPEVAILVNSVEEYANDIISYFLSVKSRMEIQLRLRDILNANPDVIILAHSLGSVVAYETLKNFDLKIHTLFTFGSPLSKGLVQKFLQVPDISRPQLENWFNIWSLLDPVSGKIQKLGCYAKDQYRIRNTHNLLNYIYIQKKRILDAYQERRKRIS